MDDFTVDEFDLIQSMMNIQDDFCALWHMKGEEIPRAVDYIVQNLGYSESNTVTEQIRIPICKECLDALNSGEWVLFYCVQCNQSRWHNCSHSYKDWGNNVIKFFNGCPSCK